MSGGDRWGWGTLGIVGMAGLASCAHATWFAATDAAVPSPDAAHHSLMALRAARAWEEHDALWLFVTAQTVVPNPVLVPLWMGLWMAVFGHTISVGVASFLPFHLLYAAGLWRGGCLLGGQAGGRAGGAWALGAGLAAPGVLASAGQPLLDFPLAACVSVAAARMLEGRWAWVSVGLAGAALTKLSALPVLAWMAVEAVVRGRWRVLVGGVVVAGLYLPQWAALIGYASDSGEGASAVQAASVGQRLGYHVASGAALGGPALIAGVILALLGRGDIVTLHVLGWAVGAVLGLLPLALFAQTRYVLPVVPLLAIAGAGAASIPWGRRALAGLGIGVAIGAVGFHSDRIGWPGPPAGVQRPGAPYDVDAVLDWLVAQRPPGPPGRVALHLEGSDRLHFGLFAVRVLERGLPLMITVVDDHQPLAEPTDLGVVIAVKGRRTVRQGWRAQLPPARETWDWPDGYTVALWDRGLPEERLLEAGRGGELRNHPARQDLYAYFDGAEHGPLIEGASSVEVVPTPHGFEALFVRDQAIWRAESADGLTFAAARPLEDAGGSPILAFDPAVTGCGARCVRLWAAELVGADRQVDPATHPTRIVTWSGPSLDALTREPGARIAGVGLVDPAPLGEEGRWELYLTEGQATVVRALSADGQGFTRDPTFAYAGASVPALSRFGWLITQAQVMGFSVFYLDNLSVAASPAARVRVPLELCGTGAVDLGARLYYTRGRDECPAPVVLPERRALLDGLLGGRFAGQDALLDYGSAP